MYAKNSYSINSNNLYSHPLLPLAKLITLT